MGPSKKGEFYVPTVNPLKAALLNACDYSECKYQKNYVTNSCSLI